MKIRKKYLNRTKGLQGINRVEDLLNKSKWVDLVDQLNYQLDKIERVPMINLDGLNATQLKAIAVLENPRIYNQMKENCSRNLKDVRKIVKELKDKSNDENFDLKELNKSKLEKMIS